METDKRNVIDEFKGKPIEEIVATLDKSNIGLEVAIENLERDFNMGTIVRSANAFGVRHLHIIGSKQWNKRGAMMTDKYLHLHYYSSVDDFLSSLKDKKIYAVDNVKGASDLSKTNLSKDCVLVFGSENSGLSDEMLEKSNEIVAIEQFGSTRSLNVGVAAGVVMYEWMCQNHL